jgi:hypothetical protein
MSPLGRAVASEDFGAQTKRTGFFGASGLVLADTDDRSYDQTRSFCSARSMLCVRICMCARTCAGIGDTLGSGSELYWWTDRGQGISETQESTGRAQETAASLVAAVLVAG